jgi:hypothetical protein
VLEPLSRAGRMRAPAKLAPLVEPEGHRRHARRERRREQLGDAVDALIGRRRRARRQGIARRRRLLEGRVHVLVGEIRDAAVAEREARDVAPAAPADASVGARRSPRGADPPRRLQRCASRWGGPAADPARRPQVTGTPGFEHRAAGIIQRPGGREHPR